MYAEQTTRTTTTISERVLQIQIDEGSEQVIVTAEGGLSTYECDRLEVALVGVGDTVRTVILDLSAVPFISTTAICLLLRTHRRVQRNGGRLRIVTPENSRVRDVLQTLRLQHVLELYGTRDGALQ
jgi:anti-anti-sigma factor